MRHIMIDLFASSLGSAAPTLSLLFCPTSKINFFRLHFHPQDYILSRPFQKGSWLPGVKVLESLCELTH